MKDQVETYAVKASFKEKALGQIIQDINKHNQDIKQLETEGLMLQGEIRILKELDEVKTK